VATDDDPLVAIQNAALERALLAETDSGAYVLLAGALERARPDDAGPGEAPEADRPGDDVAGVFAGDADLDPDRVAGSLLTATMTATLAVRHGLGRGTPPRPPAPSVAGEAGEGDRRRRLLLEGAMLARERFDTSTVDAAALAEVGVAAFERHVERRSRPPR
jgi:hypothetical protein